MISIPKGRRKDVFGVFMGRSKGVDIEILLLRHSGFRRVRRR